MNKPIDLYLLSGFLGAGKTTLLRRLTEELTGLRLGVLVNEFGSIGVDGVSFRIRDVKLVEINSGSIFCACLKDGFVRTLKAFSGQPIDALLIENSGMADPSAMPRILESLLPYLQRPFAYRGNICLVDGTTFFDYADILVPVRNQIASADAIIVNKTDLLDSETLAALHRELAALNPTAPRMDTVYAQVPLSFLQSALPGSHEGIQNVSHERPAVFRLECDGMSRPDQLEAFHQSIAESCIRLKGFAKAENGWMDVQGVGRRLNLTPAEADVVDTLPQDGLRLVLIGHPTLTVQVVSDAWTEAFGSPCQIKET